MHLDVLIASLPPNYLHEPPIAPALLKSAVQQHGFCCETIDFGQYCFQKIFDKNYSAYLEWIQIFPDTHNFENISSEHRQLLDLSIDRFIDLVKQKNPKILALSVFSAWQQRFVYFCCQKIKARCPNLKIVIGGMGCGIPPKGLRTITDLSFFDKTNSFSSYMTKKKLIDYAILNDGEIELVNLLRNQDDYQSNLISNEVNFDYNFYPNYDDYDLDGYFYSNNEKSLLVQGSKGCVRQCVFCSEHSNYSKFYFKDGEDVANEIIELSQKYDIRKFHLTDSLVNGSLSAFKKFIHTLSNYNQNNLDRQITWHGNYICRTKNQMRDDDYKTLKSSGGCGLTIGAESGSDRVLKEMKKQSTAQDLLWEIEKFHQHKIDCVLLFMVGFYNETWQDFLLTLELLKKLQKYVYHNTVIDIRLGYTLSISDWKKFNIEDFIVDPVNSYKWIYKKNLTLNLRERIRRRIILQEFCDKLGIPVAYAREDLSILDNIYNDQADTEQLSTMHL